MASYEDVMAELASLLLQLDQQLQALSLAGSGATGGGLGGLGGLGGPAYGIEIVSLYPDGPEYRFWDEFLAMVNSRWHADFKMLTAGGNVYISWSFIDGVTSPSKSQQYQQALRVARDVVSNSSALDPGRLGILEDRAQAVLRHRQWDHGRYPVEPNNPVWKVHHLLVDIWQDLVETIARRRSALS